MSAWSTVQFLHDSLVVNTDFFLTVRNDLHASRFATLFMVVLACVLAHVGECHRHVSVQLS